MKDQLLFSRTTGNQASIENALPIACGIKAPIEVEIGAFEIQPHFFGHLFGVCSGYM